MTVLLCAAAVTACSSGGSATDVATPTPSASPSASGAACPEPPTGSDAFPTGLPPDFPSAFPPPPGAVDAVADAADPSVVAVRFPSPASLAESVEFVLEQLPAAGFQITGGDQEPHEADVVFAFDDGRQGKLRIARVDDCTTFWLVQVVRPAAPG